MAWQRKSVGVGTALDVPSFQGALLVLGSEASGVTVFRYCREGSDSGFGWPSRAVASFDAVAAFVEQEVSSSRLGQGLRARLVVLDHQHQASAAHEGQSSSAHHAERGTSATLVSHAEAACARLGVKFDTVTLDPEQTEALRVTSSPVGVQVKRRRDQLIRLMIVDDSASVRALIRKMVTAVPGIKVVGEASDPIEAEELFAGARPDVMTLDLNMPRMDGISYLKKLVGRGFHGVIMITGAAAADSDKAIEALDIGAVDFLEKPQASAVKVFAESLVEKIRIAANVARAPVRKMGEVRAMPLKEQSVSRIQVSAGIDPETVVVIGASTGGTVALAEVLVELPPEMPPIVIVQHIPPVYSASFAARLNQACALKVAEATDGVRLLPGHVFVAPGDKHVLIRGNHRHLTLALDDGEPVNRHKPSVDALFESLSPALAARAVGVILTGMGADGARGLKDLRDHGSRTVAQSAETCVVFGMPREAIRMGAAQEVLPLNKIAQWLVTATRARARNAAS